MMTVWVLRRGRPGSSHLGAENGLHRSRRVHAEYLRRGLHRQLPRRASQEHTSLDTRRRKAAIVHGRNTRTASNFVRHSGTSRPPSPNRNPNPESKLRKATTDTQGHSHKPEEDRVSVQWEHLICRELLPSDVPQWIPCITGSLRIVGGLILFFDENVTGPFSCRCRCAQPH